MLLKLLATCVLHPHPLTQDDNMTVSLQYCCLMKCQPVVAAEPFFLPRSKLVPHLFVLRCLQVKKGRDKNIRYVELVRNLWFDKIK